MTGRSARRQLGFVGCFILAVAVLWLARHLLLLLFAGFLMALVFTSSINLLRRLRPLGQKSGLLVVLILISACLTGLGFLAAAPLTNQFSELAETVPNLLSDLHEKLQGSPLYQKLERVLPDLKEMAPSGGVGKVFGLFSSTVGAISSFLFIAFTALFLAASPHAYKRFLLTLLPPTHRDQGKATLAKTICTLKYFLIGQFAAMVMVGTVVGISLAVAGVPFALALGLLAGLLEFIPIAGPILASIPALLLALSEGGNKVFVVLGIFLTVQLIEGNLLTPIIQRKAIDLPPVITLAALFLLGSAFGLLGMFVAAPLAAVVLVLVEDLYLRRYLGTEDRILI